MSATLSIVAVLGGILGVLLLGWSYFRINAAKVWRETAEGWKARAEQLEKTNAEYIQRIATLEAKVSELERRPDLDLMQAGLKGVGEKLDALVELQTAAAIEVENVRLKAGDAAVLVEDVRVEQKAAVDMVADAAARVETARIELLDAAAKLASATATPLPVTETPAD